jgi:ATP-dependent Clp protease ATP-binding subunit ClpA
MFERFTVEARTVVLNSRHEAQRLKHPYIGTEHLLLALLSEDCAVAAGVLRGAGLDRERVEREIARSLGTPKVLDAEDAAALQTIGIDLDAVIARIEASFGPDALAPPASAGGRLRGRTTGMRFSRRAKKVLGLALREAIRLGDKHIGAEHILLGLIREGEGLAVAAITEAGVSLDDLRAATLRALKPAA